ncbi:unnamed protein product [Rhizophagus irregularis]|nr:unnamed protein product [Rhizophagus irregularis]
MDYIFKLYHSSPLLCCNIKLDSQCSFLPKRQASDENIRKNLITWIRSHNFSKPKLDKSTLIASLSSSNECV